ncbi:hypothetical protein [Nonomuraea longicatena]|uniref:Uncharacterized protein n=1 Tax=Nonomuraea longicatena TaxID=83682 RepID=A0ABN1R7F6_9ACTN
MVVVADDRASAVARDEWGTWIRSGFHRDGVLPTAAAFRCTAPLCGAGAFPGVARAQSPANSRPPTWPGIWVIVVGLMIAAAGTRGTTADMGRPTVGTGGAVVGTRGAAVRLVMPDAGADRGAAHGRLRFLRDAASTLLWTLGAALMPSRLVVAVVKAEAARIGRRAWWQVLATGALVAFAGALPFRDWAAGTPDDYGTTPTTAALCGAAAVALVRRSTRHSAGSGTPNYLAGSGMSRYLAGPSTSYLAGSSTSRYLAGPSTSYLAGSSTSSPT